MQSFEKTALKILKQLARGQEEQLKQRTIEHKCFIKKERILLEADVLRLTELRARFKNTQKDNFEFYEIMVAEKKAIEKKLKLN